MLDAHTKYGSLNSENVIFEQSKKETLSISRLTQIKTKNKQKF